MPKKARELTALAVRKLARPGLHAVGGVAGLYLQITETGARSWIMRATVGARRRDFGLGSYPEVTLATAQERAREVREQLRNGIDPKAAKQQARLDLIAQQAKAMSFKEAAYTVHAVKAQSFKNTKHAADWIRSLEHYAFPSIGTLPVGAIDAPQVLKILQPIWLEKTETASRLRQRMEAVFSWAIVRGYRIDPNPARWEDGLEHDLAAPDKVAANDHYAALPWQDVPAFFAELRQREGISARALEFSILTAARSKEVRELPWSEIDLASRLWTCPPERMKKDRKHQVPLSDAAMALLSEIPRSDSPLVFVAPRSGGALSDMALSTLVKRMHADSLKAGQGGYLDPNNGKVATPHGFRSGFKDWARNRARDIGDEISELALAHVNSDATRAAYARDELMPMRAALLERWGVYCTSGADHD